MSVVFVLLYLQAGSILSPQSSDQIPFGGRFSVPQSNTLRGQALSPDQCLGAEPGPPQVDFRWAFAAASIRDGISSAQPVAQDMVLKSGDQLKMMVELQRRCFVYLFHDNKKDGVKLLFPYALQQFEGDYQPDRRYYIPRGDAWFRLDENPGEEVFYLVASSKRLDGLEKAYLRHHSAEGTVNKAETARALVEVITELRKQHRELTTPAERPAPIGGALRSVQEGVRGDPDQLDIAAFADEILSTGFVARTYRIEHK